MANNKLHCKAKPTDRTGLYIMVVFLLMQSVGHSIQLNTLRSQLADLRQHVTETAPPSSGWNRGETRPNSPSSASPGISDKCLSSQGLRVVGRQGIEPWTRGLKVRRSRVLRTNPTREFPVFRSFPALRVRPVRPGWATAG